MGPGACIEDQKRDRSGRAATRWRRNSTPVSGLYGVRRKRTSGPSLVKKTQVVGRNHQELGGPTQSA
jgi:hypothetical protein